MLDKTYCLVTFGCQMNDADSEMIEGVLRSTGWRKIESEDEADFVLFNTCVVRQGAEERAVARLQRLKPVKAARPGKILGVCGCLAQKDGEALLDRLPFLDLVLGTRALPHLPAMLRSIEETGRPAIRAELEGDPFDSAYAAARQGDVVGRVNVIYGCDNFCSYCIVPYTRGRELSRPVEHVLRDARAAVGEGCKEILLIGQNVNSYRDGATGLPELLRLVAGVKGVQRLRFVTSNPRDAGEALFRAMADLPAVCESLHLPVQSGSSSVLRRMARGYTREEYIAKIERLRQLIPDIALATDFLVGFPGETEAEYEETLSLAERIRFDSAFMFAYSPREGTAAARLPDDVPPETKKRRLAQLIELQEGISREINRALEGRTVEALVERPARRGEGMMSGRTRGDKTIVFPAPPESAGRLVRLRVTGSNAHTLAGEPL